MAGPEGTGSNWSWKDVLLPAGLVAVFVGLTLPFTDFLLDDAYITFRYAEHLVDGHGIVWNVGGDPVEGATSMLWLLVTAFGHALGVPVPSFAKGVGIAAGALASVVVYGYARNEGVGRGVATGAAATMAASPAFAFVGLQGLETTLAALVALLTAIAALAVTRRPTWTRSIALAVLALLGALARPDLVLYGAGLLAGTLWVVHRRHGGAALRRTTTSLVAALLVPGLAYMGWRWSYFGYLLPNTFYIKQASSFRFVYYSGVNVLGFVAVVVGPLLPLAAWRVAGSQDPAGQLEPVAPLLAGAGLYLPAWLFIAPIQGFLWRFQMPVLPVLALAVALLARRLPGLDAVDLGSNRRWQDPQPWIALGLVILLVVFPLHPMRTVGDEARFRHQADRAAAGQALSPLEDTDASMFVTESGALPYYSGWTAVDELGLNNETIAHDGLTVHFLERYEPDLVMTLTPVRSGVGFGGHEVTGQFLREANYTLAAGTAKHLHPDRAHLYYVDPASPHADEITCRLLTMQDVTHVDRDAMADLLDLPVPVDGRTASDCPDRPP